MILIEKTVMNISFKNLPTGLYTENMLKKQWQNVTNIKGLNEGRCHIVKFDGENVLQVTIPKGKLSPSDGGASWRYRFEKPFDEFTVEYKVMVEKNFGFARGGKLPGLCGGSNPRGGTSNITATDGFSARVMWRELGVLEQYIYYIDQDPTKKWGTDFIWQTKNNKPVNLVPGVWHKIRTYIKMNAPDLEDGKIISWFDGEEVLNINLRFRKDISFAIDSFQFVTYFGGNDETWFPEKDEKIYFKDFIFTL